MRSNRHLWLTPIMTGPWSHNPKFSRLFFAGARDTLCDLGLLKTILRRPGKRAELEESEGGDHSFHLPKSSSLSEDQVHEKIAARSVHWLRESERAD